MSSVTKVTNLESVTDGNTCHAVCPHVAGYIIAAVGKCKRVGCVVDHGQYVVVCDGVRRIYDAACEDFIAVNNTNPVCCVC